ncbi:MAG TPA: SEC-C metal-binding domain-containing protein, partial [Polyangiaceae bacterium]|nr:SEC-C metal-binding domain-containing protein [Polyangiaceae bacterium]
AKARLDEKEKDTGTELLLRVFRHFYLEEIDRQWVEHLTEMEHLRDGIGLRGYGQRDPKQEYKKEGYDVFMTMIASTSSSVCTKLFKVQVQREKEIERIEREDAEKHAAQQRQMQARHGSDANPGSDDGAPPPPRASGRPQPQRVPAPPPSRREGPKIGRNDLCPCGSGQKFKKCHGSALDDEPDDAQP